MGLKPRSRRPVGAIPTDNIADLNIAELIRSEAIADFEDQTFDKELNFHVRNIMSSDWWAKTTSLMDTESIEYVLSFKQSGNWNWLFYSASKRELDNRINNLILGDD